MKTLLKKYSRLSLAGMFVVSMAILLGISTPSQAAEITELTASPTVIRTTLESGKTTAHHFTIYNTGDTPLDIIVYAKPYSIKNENYDRDFEKTSPRTEVVNWITFDQDEYRIAPHDKVEVNFAINTPASIPDGSQYAMLTAEVKDDSGDSNIKTVKRIGVLLYAATDGQTKISGRAEQPQVSWLQIGSDVKFKQRITNDGNTDFAATIEAELASQSGQSTSVNVGDGRAAYTVLPDTTRAVDASAHDVKFGFYKLNVKVIFDDREVTFSQWIFVISPLLFYAIIGFVILFILFIFVKFIHKRNKKGVDTQKQNL